MTWDEPWRQEERPSPSDIPDEYGLVPDGRGRIIASYFIGLYVLYYVGLKLFGAQATLIGGYPLLMWMALALILLTIAGMYVLVWRPSVRAEEQQTRDTAAAPVEDD